MAWLQDLLQEVPLSAVLKERVALAEQKYENAMRELENLRRQVAALEKATAELRAQLPQSQANPLDAATAGVLVYLFRAEGDERDVGIMARSLRIERGVAQYHLDSLKEANLVVCTGGNYLHHHTYWSLTAAGRRYVVENKLI